MRYYECRLNFQVVNRWYFVLHLHPQKHVAIASAVLLLKATQGKMWRYLDGVAPPPAKKKKSDNSEKWTKYEQEESKRSFIPSWKLNVGAEENEDRDLVDTACDSDGYDSGVDNASDFDSDVE